MNTKALAELGFRGLDAGRAAGEAGLDVLNQARIRIMGEGSALMPRARIGGPMPWVIAIMVALTTLAAGAGLALANVANNASSQISGGLTVQILEATPELRDRQAAASVAFFEAREDVSTVRRVSDADLAALLEPWLGAEAGEDDAIPVPALIDVQMNSRVSAEALEELRSALTAQAPAARLDAQANWLAPVFSAIASLQWLALGLIALLALTSAAAVWLAARSALGSNDETIAILHHLGATDSQIARIFQRSIAIDAVFGGLAGLLLGFAAITLLGQQFAALGSGLVTGGALLALDWLWIVAIPVLGVGVAVATARFTVISALRKKL